jgi:5-methylcytosine-specific restriction endonuclease McrA
MKFFKGQKFSKETREKMSKSRLGKLPWNTGKKLSKKTRKKISISKTGIHQSEETKRKIGIANRGFSHPSVQGNKHPNWKGGISKDKKYLSWLKNKRNRVIKRLYDEGSLHTFGEWETLKAQYNYTCPSCKRKEPDIKLTEDHIIPISKGGSDNIENIQPLCGNCNSKKHTKIIKYENIS